MGNFTLIWYEDNCGRHWIEATPGPFQNCLSVFIVSESKVSLCWNVSVTHIVLVGQLVSALSRPPDNCSTLDLSLSVLAQRSWHDRKGYILWPWLSCYFCRSYSLMCQNIICMGCTSVVRFFFEEFFGEVPKLSDFRKILILVHEFHTQKSINSVVISRRQHNYSQQSNNQDSSLAILPLK